MKKTYTHFVHLILLGLTVFVSISHAELPYTGAHQFTRQEYVTVRSLQVCVNRQGWDNEQEANDERLKAMLRERDIDFSFAKLMRENYKYEHGVSGNIRAEVDFEIQDAIKVCMQETIFEEPLESPF